MEYLDTIIEVISTRGVDLALNLLASIAIWIVGRWVINKLMKVLSTTINHGGKLDKTLTRYIVSIVSFLLTVILIMFILSRVGVETTSFAALLAGAGLAIGTAWGGLLKHFAAGVFLQILRPFKVGDYVKIADIEGTVVEVGLFKSGIVTLENVKTMISNNKIFSGIIENYSYNPYRRVDCQIKIYHSVDMADAIAKLKAAVAKVDNIKDTPAPDVEILEFTHEGAMVCVRPYCHTDHYWQVLFDTNKAIMNTTAENNWPAPAVHEVHLKG